MTYEEMIGVLKKIFNHELHNDEIEALTQGIEILEKVGAKKINRSIHLDKKIAFVKRHIKLVSRYFRDNQKYRKQLVNKARHELGYSPKTVDVDICSSLINAYNLINK